MDPGDRGGRGPPPNPGPPPALLTSWSVRRRHSPLSAICTCSAAVGWNAVSEGRDCEAWCAHTQRRPSRGRHSRGHGHHPVRVDGRVGARMTTASSLGIRAHSGTLQRLDSVLSQEDEPPAGGRRGRSETAAEGTAAPGLCQRTQIRRRAREHGQEGLVAAAPPGGWSQAAKTIAAASKPQAAGCRSLGARSARVPQLCRHRAARRWPLTWPRRRPAPGVSGKVRCHGRRRTLDRQCGVGSRYPDAPAEQGTRLGWPRDRRDGQTAESGAGWGGRVAGTWARPALARPDWCRG